MDPLPAVNVACRLLAEYIDEPEDGPSPEPAALPAGEVVRARLLGSFVDQGFAEPPEPEPIHDFVVLLKSPERRITVKGSTLRYIPGEGGSGDGGTYAVVAPSGTRDVGGDRHLCGSSDEQPLAPLRRVTETV
jgi:hypothetical protein